MNQGATEETTLCLWKQYNYSKLPPLFYRQTYIWKKSDSDE